MAKLIPGKVRSQGSLLYEAGKVSLQEVKEKYLYFRVEEESLRYSLDDDAVFCSCAFFQKKKFCTHLAAVEAFLKNDDSGKAALASLEEDATVTEETQEKVSFGSLFLDQVLPKIEKKETRYVLSAVGHEDDYSGQFLWTLRIRRLPDERSYVIRDVLAFLQTLQKEGHYAIGKSYYEPLSYLEFDSASQDVINFLQGLITDSASKEQDFFPNAGRHLYFPPTLFEEAVELLMNLDSFLLQYSLYDFSEVYFQDVHGEEDLFHFQVEDHDDFYELIITEPQVKVVDSATYLFRNGVFYHLTPQQRTLWKAIQDLPMDQDRKKRLHFDPTDQTKLSYSLKEFKKLQNSIDELLFKNGFSKNYLSNYFVCEKCKDTGYFNGTVCSCIMHDLVEDRVLESGFSNKKREQSFDNFDFSLFEGNFEHANRLVNSREYVEKLINFSKDYCDEFKNKDYGLFFFGKSGAGKTYFSSAMVNYMLDKGKRACFITATEFFELMANYSYSFYRDKKELQDRIDFVRNVDFLVLDDLGNEISNKNNNSFLSSLLDYRIEKGLNTVISSNLSEYDLAEYYDSRVASRIRGNFKFFVFPPFDLREKISKNIKL